MLNRHINLPPLCTIVWVGDVIVPFHLGPRIRKQIAYPLNLLFKYVGGFRTKSVQSGIPRGQNTILFPADLNRVVGQIAKWWTTLFMGGGVSTQHSCRQEIGRLNLT